ncbi:hypothetical protein IQK56_00060 [Pseudomonas sp. MAFF 301449]|uniref:Uncharacterized protein n=1 Tax=Pseudomonas cyclaminis TaxID=2781239 RepID=A0ABR9SKW2_9PSED|nr:hypothetical protein [Pseudomonas cyclaminis]MBE8589462.1 hypothetical protein [Pseudomonas cyclaminis]MBE8602868.1 hypothetical protein [Pseudomonas cyclaminis]
MKTAYINELGVRPWTDADCISNSEFTTTTLIDHNFPDLWKTWCSVVEHLSETWYFKREWKVIRGQKPNSKTEEYLSRKYLTSQLKSGDLLQKSEKSNTYSMIKNRPNNPIKINNLALEGSSSVFLILEKTKSEIETLWKSMLIFEKNITAKNISYFLDSNDSLLLCRFYEEETHAAMQFIYPTKFKSEISSALKKNKIQKIDIQDSYNFIHHKL